jgi:hypothetical protein
MQTFLPYPNIRKSLECLDNKRLGKQRVEAMQIINALERDGGAWYNHPATQMWKYHINTLKLYHNIAIDLWIARGFKNTMKQYEISDITVPILPAWFGNPAFHASHRSNLLRKNPEWYGQFGWTEPNDLPYIWPTKQDTDLEETEYRKSLGKGF